jgi:MFS family permease
VSTSTDDRSVAELVRHLTEQTTTLARQEIRLAQLELQEKGRRAGIGAGAFGAAGVIGLYAAGAVIAGLIILLATAVEPWLAAVIVGAGLALIAAAVALFGKRQVRAATPPAPRQAIESVKQDVDVVRESARR